MAKTDPKRRARAKRVRRIRKKITGNSDQPRLRVFKSNKHIYAQIIDDTAGKTLVSMSTVDKAYQNSDDDDKTGSAKKVGLLLAEAAKNVGVSKVVFDRGGYIYHGRIKALSEGAREGGLQF